MKLLLLAGTAEARDLAERLAKDERFEVIASLAGATRVAKPLAVETRIGGFGGEEEQEKWMKNRGVEAVIDATHPFAVRISRRTQAIAARLGVPCLQLLRPGWRAGPGDQWQWVETLEAAVSALPAGATAFFATGRQPLAALATRPDVTFHMRQIDAPETGFPRARGGYVIGRPPFSLDEERRLFKDLQIDVLVVKDAGGVADSKLAAARELGLPVILVARPPQPPGDKAASVDAALAWLERITPCA